jgi:hypothetical protein
MDDAVSATGGSTSIGAGIKGLIIAIITALALLHNTITTLFETSTVMTRFTGLTVTGGLA